MSDWLSWIGGGWPGIGFFVTFVYAYHVAGALVSCAVWLYLDGDS